MCGDACRMAAWRSAADGRPILPPRFEEEGEMAVRFHLITRELTSQRFIPFNGIGKKDGETNK